MQNTDNQQTVGAPDARGGGVARTQSVRIGLLAWIISAGVFIPFAGGLLTLASPLVSLAGLGFAVNDLIYRRTGAWLGLVLNAAHLVYVIHYCFRF